MSVQQKALLMRMIPKHPILRRGKIACAKEKHSYNLWEAENECQLPRPRTGYLRFFHIWCSPQWPGHCSFIVHRMLTFASSEECSHSLQQLRRQMEPTEQGEGELSEKGKSGMSVLWYEAWSFYRIPYRESTSAPVIVPSTNNESRCGYVKQVVKSYVS